MFYCLFTHSISHCSLVSLGLVLLRGFYKSAILDEVWGGDSFGLSENAGGEKGSTYHLGYSKLFSLIIVGWLYFLFICFLGNQMGV